MTANDKKTVLVVEDDPWARTVTSALLAGEGFAVLEAKNGEEGLVLASSMRPDVVLLDIGLPTKSGLEVLHDLKQDPKTQNTPVIIVSAFGDLVRGLHVEQTHAVVQKPFDYDELVGCVRSAVEVAPGAQLAYSA